jgi:hypothetical protein
MRLGSGQTGHPKSNSEKVLSGRSVEREPSLGIRDMAVPCSSVLGLIQHTVSHFSVVSSATKPNSEETRNLTAWQLDNSYSSDEFTGWWTVVRFP